jgi:hypothetical protein
MAGSLLDRRACIRVQTDDGMLGILGSPARFMSRNKGRFSRLFTCCRARPRR